MTADQAARWPRPIGLLLVAVVTPAMLIWPPASSDKCQIAATLFAALFVARGVEKAVALFAPPKPSEPK